METAPTDPVHSYTTPSPRGSWIQLMKPLKGLKPDVCLCGGGVCKATSFLTLLSCVKHHLSQQRRRAAIAHHNTWPTCQLCAVSMTAVGTIKCTRGGWGLVQAGLVSHTGQESKDGKISLHPRLSKKCLQCNLPRVHKRNVYKKRQIQCFGVFWCLLLF